MKRKILLLVSFAVFVGLACEVPSLVPTAAPLPSPSPTWTLLPPASTTPQPTATASASDTPESTEGPPTATTAPPTNTAEAFSCPGAPPPRVQVGDQARVTFTDGIPLRVRESPVVGNNVIAQIAEGTAFEITDGPRCAAIPNTNNSYVFWKIEVDATGLVGWVAEGDSGNYYIETVP